MTHHRRGEIIDGMDEDHERGVAGRGRPRSPLAHGPFRLLFLAQVSSLVGTGLTTIALALLAHDLAGGQAGLVLGTVLAIKMLAYVLVAPVVGGFAHRVPRKLLLVGLDVLRAGIVLALPWLTELWQVYLLMGLLSVASAGFTPVFQATIPDLLPDPERYTRALSLSRLAYDLEALASPTLAALLLTVLSYSQLFVLDGLTFALSAGLVLLAGLPRASAPTRGRGLVESLTFGVRSYLRTPRLRGLLGLHLAAAAAGAMVIVNTVVIVRDDFGLGEAELAWAVAAAGLGSMAVALLLPRMLRRVSDRTVMLVGAGVTLVALLLGAVLGAPGLIALLALWVLIGLGTSAVQTPAGRIVRRSCREGDRAAFFAADFALSHGAWLLAYLTAGVAGAFGGLFVSFAALAGLAGLGLAYAAWVWPQRDPVVLRHRHAPVQHQHPHDHGDGHHDHVHDAHGHEHEHGHGHRHEELEHEHAFVIDGHHPHWPRTR